MISTLEYLHNENVGCGKMEWRETQRAFLSFVLITLHILVYFICDQRISNNLSKSKIQSAEIEIISNCLGPVMFR